jgi:hypothetical protein
LGGFPQAKSGRFARLGAQAGHTLTRRRP